VEEAVKRGFVPGKWKKNGLYEKGSSGFSKKEAGQTRVNEQASGLGPVKGRG